MPARLALPLLLLVVARPASGQCPDGSPPPCGAARDVPGRFSVAVLPFENRARDSSLTLLAEGLADQITTNLGQVRRLAIKPPASVRFVLSRTPREPTRLAQALGSRWLVDGQLLPAGSSVLVSVQLIDATSDRLRWTGSFQRPSDDLFALISAVADSVGTAIVGTLAPAERDRLVHRPTIDNAALEAYTRGMGALRHHDETDLRYAAAQFERAVAADSTFAQAWAELAEALTWLDLYDPPAALYPRARRAAQRALDLDSTSAAALGVLATVAVGYDWDPRRGAALARRALRRDSTYGRAWLYLADALVALDSAPAATAAFATAVAADTLDEDVAADAAFGLEAARRPDAALALVRRWRGYRPSDRLWEVAEATILVSSGRCAQAPPVAPMTPIALACAGDIAAARVAADSVVSAVRRGARVPAIMLAATFVALHDHDQALQWFTRSVDDRLYSMVYARQAPIWDPLRSDPRFTAELDRIRPAQ